MRRDACIVFSSIIIPAFLHLRENIFFKKKLLDTSHLGCSLDQGGSVVIKSDARTKGDEFSFGCSCAGTSGTADVVVSCGKFGHCGWGSLRTTGIFGNFNYAAVNWSKNYTD